MKIRYSFVTKEIIEIEVNDELSQAIQEIEKQERTNNRKETRKHNSIEELHDKYGFQAVYKKEETDFVFNNAKLADVYNKLKPRQKDLVHRVFFNGWKHKEVAQEQGVTEVAISKQIKVIKKKFRAIFEKG